MGALSTSQLRIRLDLAYDGTFFHGWAAQDGLRTVQGVLTQALSTILRRPVILTVAGRTDAGVHARHQVAHFDCALDAFQSLVRESDRPEDKEELNQACCRALLRRVNSLLGREYIEYMATTGVKVPRGTADARLSEVNVVPADFDARFAALERSYTYRLVPEGQLPLARRWDVYEVSQPLDIEAMNRAAQPLLGEHEFLAFCRPREGATTIRELRELRIVPEAGGTGVLECHVRADAFCHSMVRSLVGALIEVGRGAREESWPAQLLEKASRQEAAPIAPAHGLTLESVSYPDETEWSDQVHRARRMRGFAFNGSLEEWAMGGNCCAG